MIDHTKRKTHECWITHLCSASSELDKTPSCGDTDRPFTSLHKLFSSAICVKAMQTLKIKKKN